MAKKSYKEKDTWKKKRWQEYLEKKEFRYYIFAKGSRRNHHTLKVLSVILREARFTGIWFLLKLSHVRQKRCG